MSNPSPQRIQHLYIIRNMEKSYQIKKVSDVLAAGFDFLLSLPKMKNSAAAEEDSDQIFFFFF